MKHVSTQTNRMVDVAMVSVTAAETDEAIGVGSGSGDDAEPSHDPEVQVSSWRKRYQTIYFANVYTCAGASAACSCECL